MYKKRQSEDCLINYSIISDTTPAPTTTTTSANPGSCVARFFVVVWINETTEIQNDSGTWRATVSFNSSNGTGVTSTITS